MEGNIHAKSNQGKITTGIDAGTLVTRTVEFVCNQLPCWRDRSDRRHEEAEEKLNAQLCKHLNAQARQLLPMVQFHHEEQQSPGRRVDVSAGLTEGNNIGATYYSIDDPFLVFEGKRLPAPARSREREYVTGFIKKSGGIQRFKLGLHGSRCEVAVMIGYVQAGSLTSWYDRVNSWISELAADASLDGTNWRTTEQLAGYIEDPVVHTATSNSIHRRGTGCTSESIRLFHLWITMGAE